MTNWLFLFSRRGSNESSGSSNHIPSLKMALREPDWWKSWQCPVQISDENERLENRCHSAFLTVIDLVIILRLILKRNNATNVNHIPTIVFLVPVLFSYAI